MNFSEVAAPDKMQIIAPVDENAKALWTLPHSDLFPAERDYWQTTYDEAVENGDKIVQGVGLRLKREMHKAVEEDETLRQFVAKGVILDRDALISWHNRVSKYLAWSWMWREVMADDLSQPSSAQAEPGEPPAKPAILLDEWELSSDDRPNILIEQADAEPQCGIQLIPGLFRSIFDVEPPVREIIWLEGQKIFIQAASPATPGVVLQARHQVRGEDFPAQEYVTARPVLRTRAWYSPPDRT